VIQLTPILIFSETAMFIHQLKSIRLIGYKKKHHKTE